MKVVDSVFCREFIRLCDDAWKLGWHEFHGGNLSYRMKSWEVCEVKEDFEAASSWKIMEEAFPSLGGEFFVVTGSGECFRNAMADPEKNFGIVELDQEGAAWRLLWGLKKKGGHPTSEFASHLAIHAIKKKQDPERYRIVYHAHPSNIIILSAVMGSDERKLTRLLWDMEPECPMTFPNGIGIIDWMVPGTAALAKKTGDLVRDRDVIVWKQHGVLTAGKDFDETLGIIHTVEKAAEMLIKIKLLNPDWNDGPSDEEYKSLADAFKLNLPGAIIAR